MYLQEPPRGDGASSSVNFLFSSCNTANTLTTIVVGSEEQLMVLQHYKLPLSTCHDQNITKFWATVAQHISIQWLKSNMKNHRFHDEMFRHSP